MKLRLTKQAQRDLSDATEWYAENRPWVAERFLDAVLQTLDRIAENPLSHPRLEVSVPNSSREWRRVIVRKFSYIIVYFVQDDVAVVVNVTHTNRDWTTRLSDKED